VVCGAFQIRSVGMPSEDVETPNKPGESKQALHNVPLDDERNTKTYKDFLPVVALLCVFACAAILLVWGWALFVNTLFETIEDSESKVAQALVINSVLVVMIVCCLPGPAFCVILDGFFFGFWKGFALGFVFETIGYFLCICLARTCLQRHMREVIMDSSLLKEMIIVCEEDSSGKFLVLFRFLTLPVWAKNYSIGMLDIDWLKAFLVFVPAETFYAGIFAYIGSKGYKIADAIRKGDTDKALDSFSGAEVMMVAVSISVAVLMVVLGWREYAIRRGNISEGSQCESSSLKAAN